MPPTPDMHVIALQARDETIWRWKNTAAELEVKWRRCTRLAEVALCDQDATVEQLRKTLASIAYSR